MLLPLTLAAQSTFRQDVTLVRLLASVKNQAGEVVGTLGKEEFEVLDCGVKQEIAVFDHESSLPLSVSVLIDASGSTLKDVHYETASIGKFFKALIKDGRHAEACDQLRNVVDIRSRLLGTDDPETLAALRNLASSLVWNGDYAEASIVARNVQAAMVRTHGSDHPDTLDAQRLVTDIDRRLGAD